MYDDRSDDSIPPLDRPGVAPWWRIIAIAALFGVALLGSMVVVLFMALDHRGNPQPNPPWAMAPAIAAAAGGAVADPLEDVLDPLNPAYPTRQDLRPPGTFPVAGDPEADPQDKPQSPRQEFRKLADDPVWDLAGPELPERVLISSDGLNMAYVGPEGLMVGPIGAPNPVEQNAFAGAVPPGVRMKGGMVMGAPGQPPRPRAADTRASLSGWSTDGALVAWVGENGRPCQHDMQTKTTTRFEFPADALLPLPGGERRSLVVTRELRPKLAAGADRDLTTVKVLFPPGPRQEPTLLAGPEPSRWDSPALSPDGRHLAIVSDRGEKPGRWRVWVLSADDKEKMEPVSPPSDRFDGVCWTPQGDELVYARSQSPAPADHAPGMAKDACDLYLLDRATKKETRLSRGGGFTSPSMRKDGDLYFLTKVRAGNGVTLHLLKMPLERARKYAAEQEEAARTRAKEWKELADAVFKKAGVRADSGQGETLESGAQKKIAEAFAAVYKEKLGAEPPATAEALEWQRHQVAGLDPVPADQERFRLLLGAVEGEYLIGRQKGSEWHTTKERGGLSAPVSAENAFGYAFNPFRPLRPSEKDDSPQSLAEVLYRAEGRRIVLSNEAGYAKDALDNLVDSARAEGSALLARGNGDAADGVLLEMVKRHEGNQYLVIEVGTLLHRHGRTKALAQLVKPLLANLDAGGLALAREPHLYNLVGVGALQGDANKAILAFQDALRCDLNFGPAYLNLAQAYQKANRSADARLCLRRYLKLFPEGEWADDARRRLAAAGDD